MPLRTLLCVTIFALSAGPAFGQVDGDYLIGLKLGAAHARFSGADVPSSGTSAKTGLSLGLYIDRELTELVSVQPELTYAQRGVGIDNGELSGNYNLSYLDLPLLGKVGVPLPGGLEPYALAGPTLSFQIDCRIEVFQEEGSRQVPCSAPEVDAPIKTIDYGFIAGGGLDLGLRQGSATVQLRRYIGMRPIDGSDEDADVRNRSWSVLVGWAMPYGG